jgi:FtsP/CotA-like multicopper oxidase with cupredoxin domain
VVSQPNELVSSNGTLELTFYYQTVVDQEGITRYCYISGTTGYESPTLRVNPGDQLIIHFYNTIPAPAATSASAMHGMVMKGDAAATATTSGCNATTVTSASTNMHFHGLNVSPACHQDEVIHTIIQPQGEFDYTVQIPANEPAGMYWYHPHPHGFSQNQVLGGATGIIIVDGIQNFNSAVAGLPERIFVLRDQPVTTGGSNQPGNDLSLNYIPITYPGYVPAVVPTPPSTKEFWRVANTAANSLIDLYLNYNGVAQNLQVVAIDGVPITDGSGNPTTSVVGSLVLPPGARAEFIVTTPAVGVTAQLYAHSWNNGSDGDADPGRPLANVVSGTSTSDGGLPVTSVTPISKIPEVTQSLPVQRFKALNTATPTVQRSLYFSVNLNTNPAQFYITVAGQTPAVFSMDGPPSIVVRSGTVEQWTISNESLLDHAFHIHQIHFRTLAINGTPVTDYTERDTIDVPHWTGSGPYPSVTLLMDFTDPDIVGTFVYHCHILSHEDLGMMGAIQVLPALLDSTTALAASPGNASAGASVTFTATVTGGSVTPTGTVTFSNGSTSLGTAALNSSGVATLSTSSLPAGANSITAAYAGDTNYAASTSSPASVTVSLVPTTTALTSSAANAGVGSSVTFTATVASGSGIPGGTVTFADGSTTLGSAALSGSGVAMYSTSSLGAGSHSIGAQYTGNATFAASNSGAVPVVIGGALQFVAVTPCRVADTRGAAGAFGGPELAAGATREFNVPQSACNIPSTAVAYSLNVTVVPNAALNYLTLWPAGQAQPDVSTLNSDGRVKANAAIASAGSNGGVDVFVTDATQVILDIDGYFVPAGTASALAFYSVTPCRIADTRKAAGPLGGPFLAGGTSRAFPLLSSGCGLPASAQAYSLNVTAVPHSTLNYLTTWPTGQAQPNVSTLNASTGAVTANAAIVPAGSGGEVSLFVYDDADVILDVNGYFAPPATGGLSLYTTTPCRALDTRPVPLNQGLSLVVNIQGSTCAPPASAQAFVLNATVVPTGPLVYLTLWPDGVALPNVSTLNADDGAITSNMAIVPTTDGSVDAFADGTTNLLLDLSSYFAP